MLVETVRVRREAEEVEREGIRVATMHRLKGLEFRRVLLAGVQAGQVPLAPATRGSDAALREDLEKQERCLFYVACTRARDELAITGNGLRSPFLPAQVGPSDSA